LFVLYIIYLPLLQVDHGWFHHTAAWTADHQHVGYRRAVRNTLYIYTGGNLTLFSVQQA